MAVLDFQGITMIKFVLFATIMCIAGALSHRPEIWAIGACLLVFSIFLRTGMLLLKCPKEFRIVKSKQPALPGKPVRAGDYATRLRKVLFETRTVRKKNESITAFEARQDYQRRYGPAWQFEVERFACELRFLDGQKVPTEVDALMLYESTVDVTTLRFRAPRYSLPKKRGHLEIKVAEFAGGVGRDDCHEAVAVCVDVGPYPYLLQKGGHYYDARVETVAGERFVHIADESGEKHYFPARLFELEEIGKTSTRQADTAGVMAG